MFVKLRFSNMFCISGFVTFILQQCDRNMAFSLNFKFYLFLYLCVSGACATVCFCWGQRITGVGPLYHVSPGLESEVIWLSLRLSKAPSCEPSLSPWSFHNSQNTTVKLVTSAC